MIDLDLSGRMFGEFLLCERIALGGHGVVYRCEQRELERDVIVKVLRAALDGTGIERFKREARMASQFEHPFSAHVYAFGVEDDGVRWIAMEFVRGVTLGEYLKARGPMPLEEFVPFFESVAQVVHAAHERGIVHRDIKPSNVMVIESGGRLFPKLLDFGIAKILADEEPEGDGISTARLRVAPPSNPTPTWSGAEQGSVRFTPKGTLLGSRPYMSPEQWLDPSGVGPAADIYALGCLAYEALSGRAPFVADNSSGYYDCHVRAEAPALGEGFPPGVDQAIRRALSKAPGGRHETAIGLAAELRESLRAEPREQLRSAAQRWEYRARSPAALWGSEDLSEVVRAVPSNAMSELECSFLAASHRRARHRTWVRRTLVAAITGGAILAFAGHAAFDARLAAMQARLAETEARAAREQAEAARELAETKIRESELEQGRAALLHGESEAQHHLTEAYKRDHAPATAFMLARAMQPRLSELARLQGTHGQMRWAAFSPDGSQVVTADDRAAQIWDGQTHRLLFTLTHGVEVYHAVYAPDGAWLVTVTDTTVKIWDAKTGAFIRDLATPPDGPTRPNFYSAAISSHGKFVAAMYEDGSVTRVWNSESGKLVAELRDPNPNIFPRIAFSRSNYLATTGGNDAHVFDVRTWQRVFTVPGPVRGLAFDARGRLATGSTAGDVSIFEIPSGRRLRQLRQSGDSVEALAFSSDGEQVAAGGREGTLQVWWTGSGALRSRLNPRRSRIFAVEFDPTSTALVAAHADGTAVVADIAQGLPIATLDGPRSILEVARFGPRGQVVGASRDGSARIWDATSPYRRWSSAPMGDGCGIVPGVQSGGRFVAVGCGTQPTRVWDTIYDRLLAELPSVTPIESGDFTSAFPAVSAGGDRAAIARGNLVELYALPDGRLLRRIEHAAPVSAVAFAPMGRDLVSGAVDGSIFVTRDDGASRALQAPAGIDVAALLPDGGVVAADAERRLRVFGPSGAVLADLELHVRVMSLRREGSRLVALPSYLATASPPLVVDVARPRIVARLDGHIGQVKSARWISLGRIMTAGADGTARVWDGAAGTLLHTYRGGPGMLKDAILTPDGLVIGGDADGSLRFWDAASGAKLWKLPVHKSAVIGVDLEGADIVTRGLAGEVSRWRLPPSGAVIAACAAHSPCASVP
jgi:WD40 repeat protein/serine/threonine protein kinase